MRITLRFMSVAAPLVSQAARAAEPATLPVSGAAGMVLNLLLVLALVVVCGWLYARGPARLRGTNGALDIVASRQVGSRERIAVVQVGEQQILLGITQNGISHLHTLEAPLARDRGEAAPTPFGERLRELGTALKRPGADA